MAPRQKVSAAASYTQSSEIPVALMELQQLHEQGVHRYQHMMEH